MRDEDTIRKVIISRGGGPKTSGPEGQSRGKSSNALKHLGARRALKKKSTRLIRLSNTRDVKFRGQQCSSVGDTMAVFGGKRWKRHGNKWLGLLKGGRHVGE